MKTKLRANWKLLSDELCILATCFLIPMRRNSVFQQSRVKRFPVVDERSVEEHSVDETNA